MVSTGSDPTDDATTIAQLRGAVAKFVFERDWEQFHTPKNLAMALAVEAAELMERFQWLTEEEAIERSQQSPHRERIGEEMADVLCYLLSLANAMDLDLSSTVAAKMRKNALKYPADQFQGRFERDS